MPTHTLCRVDTRPIGAGEGECRVFLRVRNERRRLGHFLDHHRSIGVHRFFIIDNDSSDGSSDFVLAQPDCHLFVTRDSYREAKSGTDWFNAVLDQYGRGFWCLTLDADELFIYPGYETVPVTEFTRYLEAKGAQGVFAFLLDMYGEESVAATKLPGSGQSMVEAAPFFDRSYAWRTRPRTKLDGNPFPTYDVIGGPRLRQFYPEYLGMSKLRFNGLRVARRLRMMGPSMPPRLTKIPLVHWSEGFRYLDSHGTQPIHLSDTTGVLLHFKFFDDFHRKAMTEAERGQFYDGATEYVRYRTVLRDDPKISLKCPDSVRYEGSEQLVRLGLLKVDQHWNSCRGSPNEKVVIPGT